MLKYKDNLKYKLPFVPNKEQKSSIEACVGVLFYIYINTFQQM